MEEPIQGPNSVTVTLYSVACMCVFCLSADLYSASLHKRKQQIEIDVTFLS